MPAEKYPILVIKADRQKSIKNRHPWIYSGAVAKLPENAQAGTIVRVVDQKGQILGHGHYETGKTIVCRMFDFSSQPIEITDEFWKAKFQNALSYRLQTLSLQGRGQGEGGASAYRLFFSEGDQLPGLTCDIFGDVASLQIRTAGMQNLQPLIVDFLKTTVGVKHIWSDGWLLGQKESIEFEENSLQLSAKIEGGQKTGYFLDQRENRALVAHYAKGKTALDCFSYVGGFGLNALKGGAKEVISVDLSQEAIEICEQNYRRNFPQGNYSTTAADCFEYLRSMEANKFDLIVLDPPAFSKSASSVNRAARGYKDINLSAMKKIKPGGLLFTFSCSQHISRDLFRKIIFGAALDSGRDVRIVHQLSQSPDHPVNIYHPEGEYLKGLVLEVS